jgi:2-polyprenyl-3-methyl-5-hydroxy-6-metoxy-1,4-benzoquinol methylase
MKSTIRSDTGNRHKNKYQNTNFLHQLVLGRFLDYIAKELKPNENDRVLDFGCGEALFWKQMSDRGVNMSNLTGVDLRVDALREASRDFPQHRFVAQDILTWNDADRFDLVIASQVLEHLPEPENFLAKLVKLTSDQGRLVLTVPWEPFFMLSNLARGRDILRFGNHPEHVNLWSKTGFARLVGEHAQIAKVVTVFPFIAILAAPLEPDVAVS